ncbi:hypothetical protein LZ30DRAFT_249985 [Colletotrichum cereale]|nr:hypothetical protein LZ30DRAFT_249985 [Colletotrichum cereale]
MTLLPCITVPGFAVLLCFPVRGVQTRLDTASQPSQPIVMQQHVSFNPNKKRLAQAITIPKPLAHLLLTSRQPLTLDRRLAVRCHRWACPASGAAKTGTRLFQPPQHIGTQQRIETPFAFTAVSSHAIRMVCFSHPVNVLHAMTQWAKRRGSSTRRPSTTLSSAGRCRRM